MTSNRFDLRGKVAVVTGGNGGIGLGLAHGLADAGANIAVVGRNEAKSAAASSKNILDAVMTIGAGGRERVREESRMRSTRRARVLGVAIAVASKRIR